jgi:Holliday junction resolvasome RuvABC ATP-dependent DNA helicase subunit
MASSAEFSTSSISPSSLPTANRHTTISHALDPHDPFARIIGQQRVISFLAEIRDGINLGAHPHPLLFLGRSGNGKTLLARAFAESIGADFVRIDCGPELKSEDLVERLTAIKSLTVIFCDEVQSMRKRVQEILYSAIDSHLVPKLEHGRLDRCADQVRICPFMLAGATNEPGRLLPALRSRMVQIVMDNYSMDDLRAITRQKAYRFLMDLSDRAVDLIVQACGSSPRRIVQILQAVDVTSAAWRLDIDSTAMLVPDGDSGLDNEIRGGTGNADNTGNGYSHAGDSCYSDIVGDLLAIPDHNLSQADVVPGRSIPTNTPSPLSPDPLVGPTASPASVSPSPRIPDEFVERALGWMGLDAAGLDGTGRTLLSTIASHGRATAELLSTVLGLDIAFTRENLSELRARHLVNAAPGRGWVLTDAGTDLNTRLGLDS